MYATDAKQGSVMSDIRKISIFRSGKNQAIRIPRDMELPEGDAFIRRDGDRLIIEPAGSATLLDLLTTLEPIEDVFPEINDPAPERIDEDKSEIRKAARDGLVKYRDTLRALADA